MHPILACRNRTCHFCPRLWYGWAFFSIETYARTIIKRLKQSSRDRKSLECADVDLRHICHLFRAVSALYSLFSHEYSVSENDYLDYNVYLFPPPHTTRWLSGSMPCSAIHWWKLDDCCSHGSTPGVGCSRRIAKGFQMVNFILRHPHAPMPRPRLPASPWPHLRND